MATDFPGRGTKMSEMDLLARYIDCMKQAEECCRGMAIMRMDPLWVKVARVTGDIREKAIKLASSKTASH